MSSLLSRRKGREEGPYVRPSLQLARAESIASDATASNIPGAGRILGLLLDAAGGRLEGFLNGTFGRYKPGPQVIFESIRNIRRDESVQWCYMATEAAPTDEEYCVLKKQCRKLLKCCRSHVLATQLKALEAVTELAIEDPYVRRVFAGILHHSYLIPPRYREPEVYTRSCKALISVKEREIYDFFLHMDDTFSQLAPRKSDSEPIYHLLVEKMECFLKDPDVSFLLGRLLLSAGQNYYAFRSLEVYCLVAKTCPHVIEWEILRYLYWTSVFIDNNDDNLNALPLAHYFPVLELFSADPWLYRNFRNHKDGSIDLTGISENAYRIVNLLENLCKSRDLLEQLRYLEDLDGEARSFFQGTVFVDEILMAYAHVCRFGITHVITPNDLTDLQLGVTILLNYLDNGDLDQQTLAGEAIIRSLPSGRYLKYAVCQYGKLFYTAPSILPHQRDTFEYARKHFLDNPKCKLSDIDVDLHDTLFFPYKHHLWLEVNGNIHPFDAAGHFPVLAGFDISGKELYIAVVDHLCCYVSDGAREVSIVDSLGDVKHFSQFEVMVLKHDPSDVGFWHIPEGAKFQTGYAYWMSDDAYAKRYPGPDTSKFSWAEYEAGRQHRFEDVVEADEQGDEDGALEDIAGPSSSEEITAPLTGALQASEQVRTQVKIDNGGDFPWDDVLTSVEVPKIDSLVTELRLAREFVEAQRSRLENQQKEIADQIRQLEERARELELEEIYAIQSFED